MLVKGERTSPRGVIFGICLIGLGLALGAWRPWETWGGGAMTPVMRATSFATEGGASGELPALLPENAAANGLADLKIELSDAAAAQLQRERQVALQRGVIIRDGQSLVPATVVFGDKEMSAQVRLKGDMTDHLTSDKWSLRIELEEGSVLGMKRFSIQHPRTRGYVLEWLMLEAARREGLLAPRATFVNVTLNGANRGVYYLEEHFAKELLESQGRREGPIVRFDEGTMWETRLRYRTLTAGAGMPRPVLSAELPESAEVNGFGERRLSGIDGLNRQFDSALAKLRLLQQKMAASEDRLDASRQMSALRAAEGEAVEDIINTRAASAVHALSTLFQREHGLYWHNVRFYHDPVRQRLEPIVFDASSGPTDKRDPMAIAGALFSEFLASDRYRMELFEHLSRMSRPEYLEGFIAAVGPQVDLFERAMQQEGLLPPDRTAAHVFEALREQQMYLLELVNPPDPVNFDARWVHQEGVDGVDGGVLEVDAWSTTQVPVIVEGFRFANGRFVRAETARGRNGAGTLRLASGEIMLPADGQRYTFRLPIDERLAALRRIEEEKAVARIEGVAPSMGMPELAVEYHTAGDAMPVREQLVLRRLEGDWASEGGRPAAPTLAEALRRHEFLMYDADLDRLVIATGRWHVQEDLVTPEGMALQVGPGVHLTFDEGVALVASGPLLFKGTADQPIVLESQSPGEPFDGIIVLDAPAPSAWRHVVVRRAGELHRSGWIMTGGVTFYHAPVTMSDCSFEDARGEDALNVFGCPVTLERVRFTGTASDAFDGDFVTGEVRDCDFEQTAADAVDVSGSQFAVKGSRFDRIGDKCISAGEASRVIVEGCKVSGASIAVASKDNAQVTVRGFTGEGIVNYGLAAYMKKPEYGPSRIEATGVEFGRCGRGLCIVQTGHEVLIDGATMPTQPVDVDEMYRQKILGQ